MSQQNIEPQVVLTADTTQYEQSMESSTQATQGLSTSIDTLGQKLNQLSKSAGKSLVKIAAADVATITAATAAYGAYEKQVSRLAAQAAVLHKNQDQQQRAMAGYERSVKSLRSTFGTTTEEATNLTLQLTKLSDHTRPLQSLSRTFEEMSHATGESASTLAGSVLTLQKVMGTPQKQTAAYADQLTTLAAGANTSASALADFATQLAPIGRMVGMTQTEVTGVATAFTKAGQDGYQAATAFSKIMSDIAYATQSGNQSDLAKYSNLIGVTVDQFKGMSGTQQAIEIFDSLNKLGPRAITELNRLGFDGMRMMKSITAMSQQTGGIGASIKEAQGAFGDESVSRGSAASMDTMAATLAKLRSEITMTAEEFGKTFAPAMNAVLVVMEKFASGINAIMGGPLGDMIKVIMTAVAPLAAFAGGLLLIAGALVKVAGAALLIKGTPMRGLIEGFRGGAPVAAPGAAQAGTLGRTGAQVAARGSWLQRDVFYNPMARAGGAAGGFLAGVRGGAGGAGAAAPLPPVPPPGAAGYMSRFARFMVPGAGAPSPVPPPGAAGYMSRFARYGVQGATMGVQTMNAMVSPGTLAGYADPTARVRMVTSPTFGGMFARPYGAAGGAPGIAGAAGAAGAAEARTLGGAFRNLGRETARLAGSFTSTAANVARVAGTMSLAGAQVAGDAAKRGAGGLIAGLGGGLSASMIGLAIAVPLGMYLKSKLFAGDQTTFGTRDMSSAGSAYAAAGGITPTGFTPEETQQRAGRVTMAAARRVSAEDVAAAGRPEHKLTETALYRMNKDQATSILAAKWSTFGMNPESRQAAKLDLIEKFGADGAEQILQDLDQGTKIDPQTLVPSLAAFGGAGIDYGKLTKKQAGDYISGGMGVVQSAADVSGTRFGTSGYFRTRGAGVAQLLQGVAASTAPGGITSDQDKGVLAAISKEYFRGRMPDFGTLTSQMTTTGVGGISLPTGFGATLKTADTSTAAGQASVLSTLVTQLAKGSEESARNFLTDFGVKEADKVNVKDQNDVNKAFLTMFKQPFRRPEEDPNSLTARIGSQGRVGRIVAQSMTSGSLGVAAVAEGNVFQQFRAIDTLYRQVTRGNKDMLSTYKDLGNVQAEIGDTSNHTYQIIDALRQRMSAGFQFTSQLMSRPQQYAAGAQVFGAQMDSNKLTAGEKDQAKMGFIQQTLDQAVYFKQMLMQQRQFDLQKDRAEEDFGTSRDRMEYSYNLSRSRAQQDFATTRKQQEEDYQLSREHANRDYNLQVERAGESYERSMKRAHADFNRSRRQQDQDYQHQVELMIKSSAMEMYNIYQRVQVQRTHSSGFLLVNAQDQLKRLQQQENNLEILRRMGMSQDAIQNLGLTKTENQQQLARMVTEMQSNPELVKQMNDAVGARMKAAGELVTDSSSSEWEEFTRQHKLASSRASHEFERSVARSHKDFDIQMKQMDDDFQTSMNDQAEAYETAQDRQQKAFSRSMDRAAQDYATSVAQMVEDFNKSMVRAQEDLDLMATNISGNLYQILKTAAGELRGKVGEQAQQVLATFEGLDGSLGAEGIKIMTTMSKIFGFDLPPGFMHDWISKHPGYDTSNVFKPGAQETTGHDGTVLPGRSIGKDNMHYYSAEHGGLHLAGGEAIMVPEFVDMVGGPGAIKQMNMAARYGRKMAKGGIVWPLPGGVPSTYPGHDGVDLNAPGDLGKPYLAAADGKISYVGWGHGYGDAVFETGPYGQLVYGHSSKTMVSAGQLVSAGDILGLVGATGHASGPHLHFGFPGGTYEEALAFLRGAKHVGSPPVAAAVSTKAGLSKVLRNRYPALERAAREVQLGSGDSMFKDGFWSDKVNANAKALLRKVKHGDELSWNAGGGIFSDPDIIGVGEKGPEMVLPLNAQGADFLADLMHRTSAGAEGRAGNIKGSTPVMAHTINAYQIDRSATFTGPITVQANNPNELVHQLRQRQRVAAMANPVMGGIKL